MMTSGAVFRKADHQSLSAAYVPRFPPIHEAARSASAGPNRHPKLLRRGAGGKRDASIARPPGIPQGLLERPSPGVLHIVAAGSSSRLSRRGIGEWNSLIRQGRSHLLWPLVEGKARKAWQPKRSAWKNACHPIASV